MKKRYPVLFIAACATLLHLTALSAQPPTDGPFPFRYIDPLPQGEALVVCSTSGKGTSQNPWELTIRASHERPTADMLEQAMKFMPPSDASTGVLYGTMALNLENTPYADACTLQTSPLGETYTLLMAQSEVSERTAMVAFAAQWVLSYQKDGGPMKPYSERLYGWSPTISDQLSDIFPTSERYGKDYCFVNPPLKDLPIFTLTFLDASEKVCGEPIYLKLVYGDPIPEGGGSIPPEPEPEPEPLPGEKEENLPKEEQHMAQVMENVENQILRIGRWIDGANVNEYAAQRLKEIPTAAVITADGVCVAPMVTMDVSGIERIPWNLIDSLAGCPVILRVIGEETDALIYGGTVEKSSEDRLFFLTEDFVLRYASVKATSFSQKSALD